MIVDGKKLQENKLIMFSNEINSINDKLKLAVVQVGNDESSNVYVKNKRIICEKVGVLFEHIKYDYISESDLVNKIKALNNDSTVTGILVQLPLPDDIDEKVIIDTIDPKKDVDGLTTSNIGRLFSGKKGIVPCTALGIMEILKSINTNLEGLDAVIVGRSKLVGLPLIKLLLNENITVTSCHSKTKNLQEKTSKADILIVAVGEKHLIKEDFVKNGAIVIDVGISRVEGKLYGDCDFDSVKDRVSFITPVPGGVGPLTITMLINNIIQAYYLQKTE